jgi:hypothetical protein
MFATGVDVTLARFREDGTTETVGQARVVVIADSVTTVRVVVSRSGYPID